MLKKYGGMNKVNSIIHIGPSAYKDLNNSGATRRIWQELSKNFDDYYIFSRSKDNKTHYYSEGKIHLYLVPGFGRKNASFFFTSVRLGSFIKKHNIDCILCQCPILGGFWATRYAKKHNIPICMELHEVQYFTILKGKGLKNKILSKIIRYSLENATIIRALNEKMRDLIVDSGVKNQNIEVVYNRVDTSLFNYPKKDFNLHKPVHLISVGNFIPSKGHIIALESVLKLQKEGYDIKITLIGGGPLYQKYQEYALEKGINLELVERIPQTQIVERMKHADIYIHPSLSEGMPRAVLEAMAMGMPIVCTNAGTTEGTIINNFNGLIVQTNNVDLFKDALKKIIDDKLLRERLSKQALSDIYSKYEWNLCFDKYRDMLEKMREK